VAHLKASGLGYTILRNGFYFDALPFVLGSQVLETEVLYPAGAGQVAFVLRTDLAAATAALLTSSGHDKQEYTLNGGTAYSFSEIAQALTELAGHPITYAGSEPERYVAERVAAGLPEPVARFLAEWGPAMACLPAPMARWNASWAAGRHRCASFSKRSIPPVLDFSTMLASIS
jgi:NAD(P)H dehydrogenase (quinone)